MHNSQLTIVVKVVKVKMFASCSSGAGWSARGSSSGGNASGSASVAY